MTKETKYGILMFIALFLLVPVMFVLIKLGVGALYVIFHYPELVITFIGGTFLGGFLNSKLK